MLSEIKNRLLHKTLVAVQDTVRVANTKDDNFKVLCYFFTKKKAWLLHKLTLILHDSFCLLAVDFFLVVYRCYWSIGVRMPSFDVVIELFATLTLFYYFAFTLPRCRIQQRLLFMCSRWGSTLVCWSPIIFGILQPYPI